MKVKNLKLAFVFFLILAAGLVLPKEIEATTYTPASMDEVKSQIESAADGDVIDLVKFYNKNEFKSGGNDFSSLGLINVNGNITIMSSDPKKAAYGWATTEGARAVYISNISFDIAYGKTLTMKGHLYLKGPENRALISGEGNLYLTERMNLSGQNGNPAIYLPKSSVKIENLMSYTGDEKTGKTNEYGNPIRVSLKYYSRIIGGDSSTVRGADAIVAKDIEVDQTNLDFKPYPYTVDQGLFIRGGNGLGDNIQGGYGIRGENISVDLSGEKNETYSNSIIISGGAGGYGQGAIIGKNINIKCAGYNKIVSGNGVDLSVDEGKREEFYYGTIEVEDGGHLDFATKEFSDQKMNSITGGNGRYIDSNGNPASEKFFNGKRFTNFYGPIILANGNASVNVYRGDFIDKGGNDMMPSGSPDPDFMDKLPHSPVIEMDMGTLNLGRPGQTDPLSIGCGSHFFNTSEAIIDSKADVNVYGVNTFIQGPTPGTRTPNTGYSDNPIAPKVGAAGIRTIGRVLVDGANICGGGIYNILSDNGSKKDQYRFGSGIKDASEVKLVNGAVVQGYGPIKYLKDKSIYKYSNRIVVPNVSAGYGLENVGSVYIENSEVHGGDISTTGSNCPGSTPGNCEGKGSAGAGIKGAKDIQIIGDSLITGGSSINQIGNLFADRLSAGSAIDGAENLSVRGGAQIYGGGSSTKSGHGIANVDNVVVEGDEARGTEPIIFGGGCRPVGTGTDKQAGSGLYMVGNATIKAGKIEAGNKLYQTYVEAYKTKMHESTTGDGFSGLSAEAYAISASGKVIIDGEGQFTPQVMSYTPFDGSVKGDPISSIFLKDNGALYVGKAKVFSGGDEAYRDKNILVTGGKYHVDIFKENTINSYEEVKDENGNPQGIKYRSNNSLALYRILNKGKGGAYSDFIKEELISSPAYDGVFLNDLGLNLYKENENLSTKVLQKEILRKNLPQGLETTNFKEEKSLTDMAKDNIILGEEVVEDHYSVKYDSNKDSYPGILIEGNAPVDSKIYKSGESATVLGLGTMTAHGYRFAGWNTSKDGSGQIYLEGDKIQLDKELVLFAKWEKIEDKPGKNEVEHDHEITVGTYILPASKTEIHDRYIYGYPDGNLLPEGKITRAEAATIAIRLKGISANNTTKPDYADLEEGAWYLPYINEALKLNLLEADNNKLRPNDPITRGEMARLLSPIDKTNTDKADFKDIVGHKYESQINQAYGNGRTIGYPDGSFKPDNEITRAEAVKMFNSIFNRVPDFDFVNKEEAFLIKFKDLNKNHWAYYELVEAANSHEFKRKANGIDETWIELIKSGSLTK
ncbi:S-layer homology domain-containing protein [Peptoniphilus catoniae]|uniref:S-layer homology domain-containing protein n=1 Tax=Peptoniphilus catoniae TaxID=1660341 RepID=UPI0010FE1641|nr:S-layer homology domain-containing protein [Peptoniphilus catoniae]